MAGEFWNMNYSYSAAPQLKLLRVIVWASELLSDTLNKELSYLLLSLSRIDRELLELMTVEKVILIEGNCLKMDS